jgi:acetyl esterase/lipase
MDVDDKEQSDSSGGLGSSIEITKKTDRSLITHIFHSVIRPIGPMIVKIRTIHPPGSPRLTFPDKIKKKCIVTESEVDGIYQYDVVAKTTNLEKCKHRIFYFAGGGWQSTPSSHHWKYFSVLANGLPRSVLTVVSYPLAPNSPAPVSLPQLSKWYNSVMQQSKQNGEVVTFAGDSAGGNIVLALVLDILRQDPAAIAPYSILAICPSVDLTRLNPEIRKVEKDDPIMRLNFAESTAAAWCGLGRDDAIRVDDPKVSPLEAEISLFRRGNVIVDGLTAGYDILGPDGRIFRDKLQKEGIKGKWLDWDKMMHCWPLSASYGLFPESQEALDWIVDVLNERSKCT